MLVRYRVLQRQLRSTANGSGPSIYDSLVPRFWHSVLSVDNLKTRTRLPDFLNGHKKEAPLVTN